MPFISRDEVENEESAGRSGAELNCSDLAEAIVRRFQATKSGETSRELASRRRETASRRRFPAHSPSVAAHRPFWALTAPPLPLTDRFFSLTDRFQLPQTLR